MIKQIYINWLHFAAWIAHPENIQENSPWIVRHSEQAANHMCVNSNLQSLFIIHISYVSKLDPPPKILAVSLHPFWALAESPNFETQINMYTNTHNMWYIADRENE